MRFSPLILLIGVAACSSGPVKEDSSKIEVRNEDFKKDRPLTTKEVPDYYPMNSKALSPALQDETLDRFSNKEIESLKEKSDSLLTLSVLCRRKEYDKAFNLAGKLFDQYQKIPSYWTQVANCHLNQGSERKALLFYNKALELSKNYVPALNNIGVMYSRQGFDQKAMVAFEKANTHSKFAKTPRYNLAKLSLRYGLYSNSLPILQGLLNESPNDVDLLNSVATAHFLMSDYQKALSHYRMIPSNEWRNPEIGLNASLALKKTGSSDEATKVFRSINEPKSGEFKSYYAVIEKQLGE